MGLQLYDYIPKELKQLPNWVCWRAVPDEKSHSGIKKEPVDPRTGDFARSNDPSTWTDFDTAVVAAERYSGIGFMFGGSGCFGVDIDDREEELKQFLDGGEGGIFDEFVNTLQSYTELSQSKRGIHIICKGKLPPGGRNSRRHRLEMYDSGRFFIMTGNCCTQYAEIRECTESIKPLHAKYFGSQAASGDRFASRRRYRQNGGERQKRRAVHGALRRRYDRLQLPQRG